MSRAGAPLTLSTPHQALYRRWRAQTFTEIVGQEAVVSTLRNAVRTGQVSHAILFTGPRGTGKTSLARILAKALNCGAVTPDGDPCDRCDACVAIRESTTLDVIEIDAASNRGINEVRELRERLNYAPSQLRRKVYILDEAHQITRDAWNALLKSLEEPPEFVTFMFASTHPQEFPPAILSRLQRFDVRRLTVDEIVGKLQRILDTDGRAADPDAVRLVAGLAAGGMRDAESILDQLLSSTGGRIEAAAVRELLGLADAELVEGFLDALTTPDPAAGISVLDQLEDRGRDLRVFLDQAVDALRARLLAGLQGGTALPSLGPARRLGAIDPTRLGPGGLRLQLELALLDPWPTGAQPAVARPAEHGSPAAAPPADRRPAAAAPRPAAVAPSPPVDAPGAAAGAPAVPPTDRGPAEPSPVPTNGSTSRNRATASAEPPARDVAPPEVRTASAATAGPPGTPTADDAPGDLDRLRKGWSEVVAYISRNPASKPLIAACRPIGVEGSTVTLGFPEEQAFLRDVAERRRTNLEEGIARFLGRPVAVRCVATNLDLLPAMPGDSEAEHILSEARRIFADDLANAPEVT
jgi:DNA polymerase III subunit gamma/tau